MKKLIFAAAAAVLAMGVQADNTYITYKMLNGYNDGALTTDTMGYYSLYARAAVDTHFGDSVATIMKYFSDAVAAGNWEQVKTEWQTYQPGSITTTGPHPFPYKAISGGALTFDRALSEEQFNYFAVVFYNDGETEGYRVVQATSTKNRDPVVIAEGTKGTWGAWQSVPEPTSAMLMLLGVAGLALKRKRA